MNYQRDPLQLFSFDVRLALLIKMGIPEPALTCKCANDLRFPGRGDEPGHTAEDSPYPTKKFPHASPQENYGRSGGTKFKYSFCLVIRKFFSLFCFFLFTQIYKPLFFYCMRTMPVTTNTNIVAKFWAKSRTKIFDPTVTNCTNTAPIWHETHINLANAECSFLFTTYSSHVPQLNFFAYIR